MILGLSKVVMVIPSSNLIILMISCVESPDDVFQSLFAGSDVRTGSMTLFVFVCYLADIPVMPSLSITSDIATRGRILKA